MAKMRIFGHRGAAGLALENTLQSIELALGYTIEGVEVDVRRSADGQLYLLHDNHTGRISAKKTYVSGKTLKELQKIPLKNGQTIPSLEDVFKLIGDKKPLTLDIKEAGCAEELFKLMDKYPQVQVQVTSLRLGELQKIRQQRPQTPVFLLDPHNPFETVQTARGLGATGVSLNRALMNPLTYWMAKRRNLEVRVYTVKHASVGRFLNKLYPGIVIYSDNPNNFVRKHRKPKSNAS